MVQSDLGGKTPPPVVFKTSGAERKPVGGDGK